MSLKHIPYLYAIFLVWLELITGHNIEDTELFAEKLKHIAQLNKVHNLLEIEDSFSQQYPDDVAFSKNLNLAPNYAQGHSISGNLNTPQHLFMPLSFPSNARLDATPLIYQNQSTLCSSTYDDFTLVRCIRDEDCENWHRLRQKSDVRSFEDYGVIWGKKQQYQCVKNKCRVVEAIGERGNECYSGYDMPQ
jgi:hypothetical protein